MTRSLAALFALVSTPAFADLTAEEVLADHLNLLSGYGLIEMATTGTIERPDGLTVEGFIGSYQDDKTRVEITTPGMELTEQPDGSVDIAYADTLEVTIHADPKDTDPISTTLTLFTTGLSHRVSGSPGDIRHDIAFETLKLGGLTTEPAEAIDELNLSADFAIAGFSTTIRLADAAPARRSVELDIAGLSLVMSALMPAEIGLDTPGSSYDAVGNGATDVTFSLTDLSTRIGYLGHALPQHSMSTTLGKFHWDQSSLLDNDEGAIDMSFTGRDVALSYDVAFDFESFDNDPLQALLDGQNISGALNFQGLDYDFEIDTPEGTFASVSSSGASQNRFSLSESGGLFFSETEASVFDLGGPALGLPITSLGYSVDRSLIDVAVPLVPLETPQPFRLRLAMEGVSTDDSIWNLFDPIGRIDRAPADLSFDIDGTTIVDTNMFTADSDVPFAQTKATLNDFRLSIAGAEVTGNGSVVDTSSTAGKPAGIAELDMTLTGINTLIDTVVDMGLLPNEQAMFARMGLSMIARPDGNDRLVSSIRVNEDGHIFANGQRVK